MPCVWLPARLQYYQLYILLMICIFVRTCALLLAMLLLWLSVFIFPPTSMRMHLKLSAGHLPISMAMSMYIQLAIPMASRMAIVIFLIVRYLHTPDGTSLSHYHSDGNVRDFSQSNLYCNSYEVRNAKKRQSFICRA